MLLRSALIAAVAFTATPVAAQSLFEGLARSAAEAVVRGAINNALTPSQAAPQAAPQAIPAGERLAQASAPARAPAKVTNVRDLAPPDALAQKKALDEFSRWRCTDCEGGWAYDSWARHGLNLVGNNLLENKIGALAVGQSVSWKGRVANGQGIVTAEVEKSGFRCKQVTWRMTKGKESAEREGLFCVVLMGNAPGVPTWVEAY